MKTNFTSKIVKVVLLSLLLFLIEVIWYYIQTNFLSEQIRRLSTSLDLVFFVLPFFIIPLLFIRENTFENSIRFGMIVGFIGGTLFLIYWIIPEILAYNPDLGYVPGIGFVLLVWIVFTFVFTLLSILGSWLSYLYRRPMI